MSINNFFERIPHNEAKRYRKEFVEWLIRENLPYFDTFTANRECSLYEMEYKVRQWHARVDRFLLGRNWAKKVEKRTVGVAFFEKLETNIHVHTMIRLASSKRELSDERMAKFWNLLMPGGDLDVQISRSRKKVACYVTKMFKYRGFYESFFII
jgi:hypothetical protein